MRRLLLGVVLVGGLVAVPVSEASQSESKVRRLPASYVDAGGENTCAILKTGVIRCWGEGNFGKPGYGNTSDIGDNELPSSVGPVSLGTGRKAYAVDASSGHTCVILDTRDVMCWGFGNSGRLGYANSNHIGDNELPSSAGIVDIGTGRKAVAIAAGGLHTCVILDTGQVRCWGSPVWGQLGYGNETVIGDTETPGSVGTVPLGAGRKAVAIAAGGDFTCVILDNKKVRCWGRGTDGRTGHGNETDIGDDEPTLTAGTTAVGGKAAAISAGSDHACVLLTTGKVRCWGVGFDGRLGYGNGNAVGDNETPASVPPVNLGRRAVAISAGGVHTCALLDNGKVRCWGRANGGQLGYANANDIGDNETPAAVGYVNIGAGRTARAISAGGHTCALLDNGAMRCWGMNLSGQLGYGNTTIIGDSEVPGSVGTVSVGGPIATKRKPTLTEKLSKARDRTAPYGVTASGKLSGAYITDRGTCSGTVLVTAKMAGAAAVHKRAQLTVRQGDCTFRAYVRLVTAGRWSFSASFAGNGSLKADSSVARAFRAG
jgi:alpha-tubulin suppressor-like RCC1 family protein